MNYSNPEDDCPVFLDDKIDEDELERLDLEVSIPSAAERNL